MKKSLLKKKKNREIIKIEDIGSYGFNVKKFNETEINNIKKIIYNALIHENKFKTFDIDRYLEFITKQINQNRKKIEEYLKLSVSEINKKRRKKDNWNRWLNSNAFREPIDDHIDSRKIHGIKCVCTECSYNNCSMENKCKYCKDIFK